MKVIGKTRKITDKFNRELLFFYYQKHKMRFKLLVSKNLFPLFPQKLQIIINF